MNYTPVQAPVQIPNLYNNTVIAPNYPVFQKDAVNIIIMQVAPQAGGTIKILGRTRKLIKNGRTLYVRYKNELITLATAKKFEKKR